MTTHAAAMVFGKRRDGGGVVLVKRDILALLRGTTVTRRDVEFAAAGTFLQFADDGVFSSAAANHQNIHSIPSFLSIKDRAA